MIEKYKEKELCGRCIFSISAYINNVGDLIIINDHIDKSQSKKQYLGYEKVKVLEETIKSFIDEITDLPKEKYIHYFIKIVKKQIPIFDNKFFDCKYICF